MIFLAVAEVKGEGGKTSALKVKAEGEAEGKAKGETEGEAKVLVFCI